MASIVGETEWALKQINGIGKSKRDNFQTHKAKNGAKYRASELIHSFDYYEKIQAESVNFAKWARQEHGIRSIYQLEPKHHTLYIQKKQAEGVSPGQLANIESYMLKLQTGMEKVSIMREKEPTTFIEGRTIENNKRPHNRAYRASEANKLAENLPEKVRLAQGLSVHLGLRAREAANIRKEHVLLHSNNKVSVIIPREEAKGITKGGRERYVERKVPETFYKELKNVLHEKEPGQKIVGVKTATLRKGLERACKASGVASQGWHGFRHSYSRNRIDELFETTGRATDCRNALKQISDNRQAGKPIDTGFSEEEKEVFEEVKDCINSVHNELGHGNERWGLADVYVLSS